MRNVASIHEQGHVLEVYSQPAPLGTDAHRKQVSVKMGTIDTAWTDRSKTSECPSKPTLADRYHRLQITCAATTPDRHVPVSSRSVEGLREGNTPTEVKAGVPNEASSSRVMTNDGNQD